MPEMTNENQHRKQQLVRQLRRSNRRAKVKPVEERVVQHIVEFDRKDRGFRLRLCRKSITSSNGPKRLRYVFIVVFSIILAIVALVCGVSVPLSELISLIRSLLVS